MIFWLASLIANPCRLINTQGLANINVYVDRSTVTVYKYWLDLDKKQGWLFCSLSLSLDISVIWLVVYAHIYDYFRNKSNWIIFLIFNIVASLIITLTVESQLELARPAPSGETWTAVTRFSCAYSMHMRVLFSVSHTFMQ